MIKLRARNGACLWVLPCPEIGEYHVGLGLAGDSKDSLPIARGVTSDEALRAARGWLADVGAVLASVLDPFTCVDCAFTAGDPATMALHVATCDHRAHTALLRARVAPHPVDEMPVP